MKITKEEILKFIKNQPDDREVNMRDNDSDHDCGCVMVHYGKEVLYIQNKFGCGTDLWQVDGRIFANMDFCIVEIAPLNFRGTYGDLKSKPMSQLVKMAKCRIFKN